MKDLPSTQEGWAKLCSSHGVNKFGGTPGESNERLKPGSDISIKQFLELRVLRRSKKNTANLIKEMDKYVERNMYEEIKNKLSSLNRWNEFLAAVSGEPKTSKELGEWATVLEYNGRAWRGDSSSSFAPINCPGPNATISQRTRSKVPEHPKRPQTPPQATKSIDANVEELNQKLAQASLASPIRFKQSVSPVSPEQHLYGEQGNEVTVNTALVHLCATADLFVLEDPTSSLSFEQRAFKFTMKSGGYFTARVDGVLELTDGNQPLAIMEVKAGLRIKKPNEIAAQESAEFVAWIMSYKPQDWNAKEHEKTIFRYEICSSITCHG